MNGLMMSMPLLVSSILRHAERSYPEQEIFSITADNPAHRYTFADFARRARRLANALKELGVQRGDRIATLAWNDYRHLEAYYAIGGAGFVCHTINPRLFPEQLAYIINHAQDQWLLTDVLFLPLLEKLAEQIRGVKGFIVLTSESGMQKTSLPNVLCYEKMLAEASDVFEWPVLDENTAVGLCYTSGTTGNPKGVLYSHRSQVLHAYASALPDALDIGNHDTVLPVVPLFHVNAWGTPYSCLMVGAKLVFPGPKMGDGETLCGLIERENVTTALGVPTVWLALLQYCEETGKRLTNLQSTVIGGAAVPLSMIRDFHQKHGVWVKQGWGMTEMSPLGTVGVPKSGMAGLPDEQIYAIRAKAGRGIFGVEMRIVGDDGKELPWDGKAFGALQVRGPWVCSEYYRLEGDDDSHTEDGWFNTGDVAKIDPDGFMSITDRTKDVIKSGGEWISSIEIENLAVGHPGVAEAAVIGVAHPKWTERPLLIVVRAPGDDVSRDDLLDWLDGKIASWWIPDDVAFVDEIPHTATGKIRKTALREQFAHYSLPAESG